MGLVEKIPPLVSALAFGYGVGMAVPESPLDGALNQPEGKQQHAAQIQSRPQIAPPLSPTLEQRLPGGESDLLKELRASRAPSRFNEFSRGDLGDERRTPRAYDEDLAAEADDFESAGNAALSRLQLPDFGLGISRQTLKYVRFFTKTDRGRNMFETWLKRSGRYQELVQEELRNRRLPEDLIWVAMIESGFDANARSPVGAVGLWQFMPATGAVYGLKQNKFIDQRRNPKLATVAAAHHLRDLYARFGQWDLALAAYNMGYEQLLDRIDSVGTTDFNELVRAGVLPSETAKYVPKIVAAAIVANNLERFDFDRADLGTPVNTGEIAVPPRTPLDAIAKAAGISTAQVRKLNPDVLGKQLPPGKGEFLIQVPAESVSRAVAALPTMLELADNQVDRSDVLDPMDLMSPEGYRPRASDEDGSLLSMLPKPKKKRTRSFRDPLEDMLDERLDNLAAIDAPRRADDNDVEPVKKKDTVLYRVGPSDTWGGIAKQFATDADDLARDNGFDTDKKPKEGTLLRLNIRRDLLDSVGKQKRGDAEEKPKAKRPAKG
jgi:membrane-bound lytic murein transglycosylase D